MKFIREIITGRSEAGGRTRPEADAAGPTPARAPALDLQAYSVRTEPPAAPRPVAVENPEPAQDDAAAAPASWARSGSGRVLSRNLADAIREPETAGPKIPEIEDDAGDSGDDAVGMEDLAPDETASEEAEAAAVDDAWDELDALLAQTEEDDGEPGTDEPEAAGCADDPETGEAGDDDEDDDQMLSGTAPEDTDAAVRRMFVRDAQPSPELPPFRHRPREMTMPAPVERAADVTPLRDRQDDPFQRLERMSRDAPAQDAPSPFERLRERRVEPRDEAPAAAPGRPRTRLSDEMMAQMAADKPAELSPVEVPAPAAGRAGRRAGRVKTRLLGFGGDDESNPFDTAGDAAQTAGKSKYPVGWLAVAGGPGRGHAFTLFAGVSQIGRGEDQAVRLDFGDNSISRQNHAAIAYDRQQKKFYLGHGGKANLVRLNGKPVLSTEELATGSRIHIGETTLQFVALCGAGFDWDRNQDDDIDTAVYG